MKHAHILLIFDSITNSVFEGQVLQPFLHKYQETSADLHLISFERTLPAALPAIDTRLTLHLIKRLPYIHHWLTFFQCRQVLSLLERYTSFTITARGPFAGLVAYKIGEAVGPQRCTRLTIQARGILTDEYRISSQHDISWKKYLHRLRSAQFAHVERLVYNRLLLKTSIPTTIEVVSEALQQYLITHCQTPQHFIQRTEHDIPAKFPAEQIAQWRTQARAELKLPLDATVYVYNGSAKAWQCPEETLHFFMQKLTAVPHAYLLILTQDIPIFLQLLHTTGVPKERIRLLEVAHTRIYHYLAAADYGIIFRQQAPTNWVSRPTKILEYRAAGLPIIHNGTIAMLHDASDAFIHNFISNKNFIKNNNENFTTF
jgi:hypothetical protein